MVFVVSSQQKQRSITVGGESERHRADKVMKSAVSVTPVHRHHCSQLGMTAVNLIAGQRDDCEVSGVWRSASRQR